MKVVKPARVHEHARTHPEAEASLTRWLSLTRHAVWHSLADVRRTFPHADAVKVASGRAVVVFNIAGNRYRLITAIHYDRQRVFVLRFMPHAEYGKDRWKEEL